MDQSQEAASTMVTEIVHLIAGPNFYADPKVQQRLNEIIQNSIHQNSNIYLNVGMALVNNMEQFAQNNPSISLNEYNMEMLVYFGLNLLENVIKYHWYSISKQWKEQLKQFSIFCCDSRLFTLFSNPVYQARLSTSKLILNTCSRLITEIFIREWPNNWKDFLPKITTNCSLVTLYTMLNISDYLNKLFLPDNPIRRKEITKVLTMDNSYVLNYTSKCLSIMDSNEQITQDYKQLILIQTLETLDSLIEWYPLNEEIVSKIIAIVKPNLASFEMYQLKMQSLRCIQTLIKRQNKRMEDTILINDMFFNLAQDKFTDYMANQSLIYYFKLFNTVKSDLKVFELFITVLDIVIEIVCRVVNLYNRESTHSSIIKAAEENQLFWSKFIQFCFECFQHNNVIIDEILLKFFILYSKTTPTNNNDSSDSNEKPKFLLPISYESHDMNPLKILILIGCFKLEPKTEDECSELMNICYNLDSYESYQKLFRENKGKFLAIVHNFLQNQPKQCRIYCMALLNDFLGPLPIENFDPNLKTNLTSWHLASTICSTLIPKLNFSSQDVKVLEICFSKLLEHLNDAKFVDIVTMNSVLSCLSSMSSYYSSFSMDLIKTFIDKIFYLMEKTHQQIKDQQANDANNMSILQNHSMALFVKLTKNCYQLFVPHFQIMLQYINDLQQKEKINMVQVYYLYEGLFILSNYLPIEEQRSFIVDHFFQQISWFKVYDLGVDGVTLFNDLNLSKEPRWTSNNYILPPEDEKIFRKLSAVLNLLMRLYKRIDWNRCFDLLWPLMLDYIVPFCKIISYINQLWYFYHENNPYLSKLCHPFYMKYLFQEIPFVFLSTICADQTHILPDDKYRSLKKEWDKTSPPPMDLVGLNMQHRIWVLYSNSIELIQTNLAYLFLFYSNRSSHEELIEQSIQMYNSLICSNMKYMPIFVYHDLIRHYFQCMANYAPRNERFLVNSRLLETLSQFMEFMFMKLNENLLSIQCDKDKSQMMNTAPNSNTNNNPTITPQPIASSSSSLFAKNNNDNHNKTSSNNQERDKQICFEILMEAILNNVCLDFVSLLNAIFSPLKNSISNNIIYDNNHSTKPNMPAGVATVDDDEEMMDDEPVNNVNNVDSMTESVMAEEEGLLSKFLMTYQPKTLASVVIGCLQWPISNLKPSICMANHKLISSLVSRNLINTSQAFFDLTGRILQAISRTERSDPDTFNRLVNLLLIIYEHFVYKHNNQQSLTRAINEKLSEICGTDLNEWNKFSDCFRNGSNFKKKQKMLRSLVEDITYKELSTIHSMTKANVLCLGQSLPLNKRDDKNGDTSTRTDNNDIDTGFLSWL